MVDRLKNYVDGAWRDSTSRETLSVLNPATAENLAEVPLSAPQEVHEASTIAQNAFAQWRRTPVCDRVQPLYKLKALLEENLDALAAIVTRECGKTHAESVGEIRRGIENVEVACGMPSLIQGHTNEDIASGIDEIMLRQPLGVVAAITPFNFPAMIPLWFLPYAVAAGNCFILKPSERVPLSANFLFKLIESAGFPSGVVQLIHGSRETVETLLDDPNIQAISFVGSYATAQYVYQRAAAKGKRAQCQGGAKNPIVILPDADVAMTTKILADSAFGCAGQRCLAASVVITVGEARGPFTAAMAEVARTRKVGCGSDPGMEMGPVISAVSKSRIESLIAKGAEEGARILVDGRGKTVKSYERGFFVFPTILDEVPPESEIARTEIFGPALSLMHATTLEDAVRMVNARPQGNMACIFTRDGANARYFRYEAHAGNIGVNVGVAAPMAFYPFSGWGESFFGDLHAQAHHAVEFYTQTKVVIERWPNQWSRKF